MAKLQWTIIIRKSKGAMKNIVVLYNPAYPFWKPWVKIFPDTFEVKWSLNDMNKWLVCWTLFPSRISGRGYKIRSHLSAIQHSHSRTVWDRTSHDVTESHLHVPWWHLGKKLTRSAFHRRAHQHSSIFISDVVLVYCRCINLESSGYCRGKMV